MRDLISVKSYSFDPLTTRSVFKIPSRDNYVISQYSNVCIRLHFEYKLCKSLNGLCYFVTFTYNDSSILHFGNHNFIDNSDIRTFCNKSIFPRDLKLHGYTFKFAFFGESGDGKGSRGLDNNPHFHALFFLFPTSDCDFFYHDSSNFLLLCHNAWNQDRNSFQKDYRSLNVGNVTYSKKGALVEDTKVFSYCSMYCVKGLYSSSYNVRVREFFYNVAFFTLFDAFICPIPFDSPYRCFVYPYESFLSIVKSFVLSSSNLSYFIGLDKYTDYPLLLKSCVEDIFCKFFSVKSTSCLSYLLDLDLFQSPILTNIMSNSLFTRFYKFLVNRHLCRYRLSSNLGINGLDYIDDNFMLDVSFIDSMSYGRINLPSYYFRKFLFNSNFINGKYIYVPNHRYSVYVNLKYSSINFYKEVLKFINCKNDFLCSLDDSLRDSLNIIPANVFVSFKAFRGLSYLNTAVPFISFEDPWSYLRSLDFTKRNISSIVLSLSNFISDYSSFTCHPFFCYENILELSYLYDEFVSPINTKLSDVSSFFRLKLNSDYFVYEKDT